MSIYYNYNNPSVYYNSKTTNQKNVESVDASKLDEAKFDFNKLNANFADNGLEGLQKTLEQMKQNNVIKDFTIAIDVSSNKQILSVDVDGKIYSFMGVPGEFVA